MRRFVAVFGVLLATVSGSIIVLINAQTTRAQDRPTLRLVAGLGEGVVSANDFIGDPNLGGTTVRVLEGTRVVWTLGSDETHTVTFPAGQPIEPYFVLQSEAPARPPMINPLYVVPTVPRGPWDGTTFIHAELQQRGQEVEITFARLGRYEYLCLFHPPMSGVVEVVTPGAANVTTQVAVDQLAAVHLGDAHAGQIAEIMATRSRETLIAGPRGTTVAMIRAGTNWRWGHLDIHAFLPDHVSVHQGDTVVWYVDHVALHTVTFRPLAGPDPELLVLQLPDGRTVPVPAPEAAPTEELLALLDNPGYVPRLVFGTGMTATTDPVHDGRSLYSSGLIGEHAIIGFAIEKAWGLTFNTPGTFNYTCLLHEQLGMKGTVTVIPR